MAKRKTKIITCANTKGGAGKTTLAVNIAGAALRAGRNVVIIDTDVQGSATAWRAFREADSLPVLQILDTTVYEQALALDADLVIIDAGGRATNTMRAALCAAEGTGGLVLVPVLPSPLDFWATGDSMLEALAAVTAAGYRVRARAVINQAVTGSRLVSNAIEAVGSLGRELPLLDARLGSRAAFRRAMIEGKTVFEIKDANPARAEVEALYKELAGLLHLS